MDIRIQRTRAALQGAVRDLTRDRALEDVSIGDICARAGVNRSSFYHHYPNKETLAADSIEAEIDRLAAALLPDDRAELERQSPAVLAAYLCHVQQNEHLYRALASESAAGVVSRRLYCRMAEIISSTVDEGHAGDVPLDFVAAGVASATLGMIGLWLTQADRAPVDTVAQWIITVLEGRGLPRGSTTDSNPTEGPS